jgi:hypothetical protein
VSLPPHTVAALALRQRFVEVSLSNTLGLFVELFQGLDGGLNHRLFQVSILDAAANSYLSLFLSLVFI